MTMEHYRFAEIKRRSQIPFRQERSDKTHNESTVRPSPKQAIPELPSVAPLSSSQVGSCTDLSHKRTCVCATTERKKGNASGKRSSFGKVGTGEESKSHTRALSTSGARGPHVGIVRRFPIPAHLSFHTATRFSEGHRISVHVYSNH